MPDQTADHRPELLTITEVAELLRAPVATLRYWRHLGTGPASFRLGRRVLYRRSDLSAWIDAQHDHDTVAGRDALHRLTRAGRGRRPAAGFQVLPDTGE